MLQSRVSVLVGQILHNHDAGQKQHFLGRLILYYEIKVKTVDTMTFSDNQIGVVKHTPIVNLCIFSWC
jgi:hypothetical protein